jgi:hypothetical protein
LGTRSTRNLTKEITEFNSENATNYQEAKVVIQSAEEGKKYKFQKLRKTLKYEVLNI